MGKIPILSDGDKQLVARGRLIQFQWFHSSRVKSAERSDGSKFKPTAHKIRTANHQQND